MTATTPFGGHSVACKPQGKRSGFGRRLLLGLKRIVFWPARVANARRGFAALAHMTDHELHDIGLTCQDLWNATSLPLDADPTRYWADAAAENCRSRRGMANRHRQNQ